MLLNESRVVMSEDIFAAKAENGAANDVVSGTSIKSLAKALEILSCVGETPDGAGVSDISARLGINKATVSKMLSTMAARRFVRKDIRTRRYRLGYRLAELGMQVIESIDLRAEAYPYLKALEKSVNEVINLAVYHNGEVIYVDKFEGTNSLRLHSRVGGRASLTCTSVGKVLMAFLPEQDRRSIIAASPAPERRTKNSIQTWKEFDVQLSEIRRNGCAFDLEENVEGIMCVGAPIFDYSERAVGAVSISCPTARCSRERLIELKDRLVETCLKISESCGCSSIDA